MQKLPYRRCGFRKISGTRVIRIVLSSPIRWMANGGNRAEFFRGREQMQAFLTRKWSRELDYRLIKEIWTFRENRIAVRFAYECHDDSGNWFRSLRE
jgi:nuclear transport factor 2 (NTF2) superfamily protein